MEQIQKEQVSPKTPGKKVFKHIQVFMFRGLLAVIPILLCWLAVHIMYVFIDKRIMVFLSKYFEVRKIPGMGILLLLLSLYLLGLIVSNIIGHRIFKLFEDITQRIPFINTIYGAGKQLSHGLSMADGKQTFQKAVLVKLGNDGLMIPGFIMNSITSPVTKEEYFFVLIPTAPTPASGFVCVVKANQIHDPGWTVEECLKAIVSVGIVTPKDKL
jgi:uncharacterized membrane protein